MKGFFNKLVELILPLEDKINSFLAGFSDKTEAYPLYIALLGVAVLVVLFIAALIGFRASKLNKLKKNLKYANEYIESIGIIDEHEVPELYNRIERLPKAIQQGWSKFMEQQVGYPSDYIDDQSVFADKKVDKIKDSGRNTFALLGEIIIFITLFAVCILSRSQIAAIISNPSGIANWTALLINVLLGLALPNIVLLIFYLIYGFMHKRLTNKVASLFDEFQDLLDRSITLMREEVPEYVSENMQEINAYIEEILKNRLEDKEIIQLVTMPEVEYTDFIEDTADEAAADVAPEPEPEPQIIEEPVAQKPAKEKQEKEEVRQEVVAAQYAPAEPMIPLSEVDQRRYLEQLVVLVEMAIKDTKNTTKQDLEDLAVIIATAKENGYPDKRDQKLLDDCLYMLSDLYYS
jgi:ABC-type multidrug transport system fused ATPase/permease subunit